MEDKPTYYQKNKDKIKKQVRENYFKKLPEKREYYLSYYQKNKQKIADKNKSKVVCPDCKRTYSYQYYKKHVCLSNITSYELKEDATTIHFD